MGEGRIPEISEDAGDKLSVPLAPFHVVGLQMASRSQLLYCDIAIIPANQEQPNLRTKKPKKKSKIRVYRFSQIYERSLATSIAREVAANIVSYLYVPDTSYTLL